MRSWTGHSSGAATTFRDRSSARSLAAGGLSSRQTATSSKPAYGSSEAAMTSALYLPRAPRSGFRGALLGVRTPHGRIDMTAGPSGVSWTWSRDEDAGDRVVAVV
mmetsp:Transcript_167710/g.538630  ORF Transcript_167710/g.538630 Transcript_167710/m.538630 type:complete len:105 (-) Transcript_167710:113-427(-)